SDHQDRVQRGRAGRGGAEGDVAERGERLADLDGLLQGAGADVLDLQGVLACGQAADAEAAVIPAHRLAVFFQYPNRGTTEPGQAGCGGGAAGNGGGICSGDGGEQGQGGSNGAGERAPAQGRTGRHWGSSGLVRRDAATSVPPIPPR